MSIVNNCLLVVTKMLSLVRKAFCNRILSSTSCFSLQLPIQRSFAKTQASIPEGRQRLELLQGQATYFLKILCHYLVIQISIFLVL